MTEQATRGIRRLPEDVVARIAAGEMISRPAAALKELIENALDADAGQITVEVSEALDRFLRVSDDGQGISAEELPLALERYSTSKITAEEDLLAVNTLGFRGEALASIAEIARLTVVSRAAGAEHGAEIRAEAGVVGPVKAAARAVGTSVTVEDLFFNTPVRKRFLRKGPGEIRLARTTLTAYATSYPGVGWRLTIDEQRKLDLPPSPDLRGRLLQIHGPKVAAGLLEINWREKEVVLRGFVGVPELARRGSQHQMFFVNGRWVAAPWIGQAVRHGYGDLVSAQQNPWIVLHLVIPPGEVDVNLHPTKREVRFADERWVFGCVQRAIHQAVAALLPRLFIAGARGDVARKAGEGGGAARPPGAARSWGTPDQPRADHGGAQFDGLVEAQRLYGTGVAADETPAGDAEGLGSLSPGGSPADGLVSLWQLHNRYVLAQTRKGLLLIDQHAAHERILYEAIRARMERGDVAGQQLLFPVVLELDDLQMSLFQEHRERLISMGFSLEEFAEQSVLVRGVPPLWRARSEAELLRDLLDEAGSMGLREGETVEGLARSFACRAAIKSGDPLSVEEMNRLVDSLFATQRPHGDPHGRPTFVFLSLQDLDRRFGRGGAV